MKKIYLYFTALSCLLFSACTQEDAPLQGMEQADGIAMLCVQNVTVDEFAAEATSRVINDGVTVSFESGSSLEDEKGDVIGILLIDEQGKGFANVPFKYIVQDNQNQWVNKDKILYSKKIAKAIAYFPYTQMEQFPSSVEDLKCIKLAMNETETEFKNKDLLVSEIEQVQSHQLSVDFKHAFSLVSFSGEKFIEVGGKKIPYLLDLSKVAFSIGDEQYTPELMNGRYYCLLNENELKEGEFRYFYTVNDVPYIKTIQGNKPLLPNHSYAFPCSVATTEREGIAPGDFYCTTSDNQVVILPGNAAAVPEELICRGIVFHVMNEDVFNAYAQLNGLTASDYSGYDGHHGLLVSVMNGKKFGTTTVDDLKAIFGSIESVQDREVLNGFQMTEAVKSAASEKGPDFFIALQEHGESVTNATSWYLPSFGELNRLIQGNPLQDGSTAGQDIINRQLDKVPGGVKLVGNLPSITFDMNSNGFCIMQSGSEMGWHGIPDEPFRPVCAF